MKMKVLSVFRDKYTGVFHHPGDIVEIEEEARVLDIESKKLAERVVSAKPSKPIRTVDE